MPPDSDPSSHSDLKRRIQQLPLQHQQALHDWLGSLIAQQQAAEASLNQPPLRTGRELVEQRRTGRITYQLEKVRCGKANCRCAAEGGELHGPYWYCYRWNGKKVVSQYIGKRLPEPDPTQPPQED